MFSGGVSIPGDVPVAKQQQGPAFRYEDVAKPGETTVGPTAGPERMQATGGFGGRSRESAVHAAVFLYGSVYIFHLKG